MDEKLDEKTMAGLLGLLAHDLRNPLSALHSNVGFLGGGSGVDPADFREAVADALVSCDGLVAIIDNIELLAQALADADPKSSGPVSLGSIVAEVVTAYRSMAESHEVELELDASAADHSMQILVHRDMYRRALANLVRNAIQHGTGRPVRIAAEMTSDSVRVLVTDHGPKLDAELGEAPFTASGQLAAKTKIGGRYGRGLGLFAAAYAARSANSEVGVDDVPSGAGNVFVLSSPCP